MAKEGKKYKKARESVPTGGPAVPVKKALATIKELAFAKFGF